MRQIMQQLQSSKPEIVQTFPSRLRSGHVQVLNEASIVSAGTERMLVEFAGANLLGKARQQPERLLELRDKIRNDGLLTTVDTVRSRLSEPVALGYASAGRIIAVDPSVTAFAVGDRVATNGPHAEIVTVPQTMCALIPDDMPAEHAAFATLGAIALEGVRLSSPNLGETFVVIGLGLIGLLSAQLLQVNGCRVLGIDNNPDRLALAASLGIETVPAWGGVVETTLELTRGRGVDGVLLTLSSTSSDPIHDAAQMCRRRGRIVLIGVSGLELRRADFFEKELTFQVSCSYGPGRYDPSYEDSAIDYPFGDVRWTAGRNMQAFVDMMGSKKLSVDPLITHRIDFDNAERAYSLLTHDSGALGIVLTYAAKEKLTVSEPLARRYATIPTETPRSRGSARLGIIGSGNFVNNMLLPSLRDLNADVHALAGGGGSAASTVKRFGIPRLVESADEIFADNEIDAVFVMTRHDSHASLVATALEAGKDVFVEKPLAIDMAGLNLVLDAYEKRIRDGSNPILGIGFNRRFSVISERMASLLKEISVPKVITITVNAGAIPARHWTQDPAVGGGRIVGEACHFVDLSRFLVGRSILEVHSIDLESSGSKDSAVITLRHDDGSISNINYLTNGSKRYPKEQVTVFAGGHVLVNNNFRSFKTFGKINVRPMHLLRQDKGHSKGFEYFIGAVCGTRAYPISMEEIAEVTRATLTAAHLD